ncbi:hypothetical protein M406DRAFT_326717 [Cryphonectria parasitica EP155]|uniref:F-box domain-containing protein n=1 Tax=Cryphonectria parasitica (strain ATCC 38755 / EP155) TaxID=660469 RepID=A0A9P5CVG1_CRYP1|nr:uncharacterized protein M406DRAFT_326717 [Cryphonectria parasitica EP155]KAF3771332.1 hypothetical protein M406DRAFT_326717 [Cryphonectria parasitica EP155]
MACPSQVSAFKPRGLRLTRLPLEVLFEVLEEVTNFKDLLSLISTCRGLYHVFLYNKRSTMLHVACNYYGLSTMNMALGIVKFPMLCEHSAEERTFDESLQDITRVLNSFTMSDTWKADWAQSEPNAWEVTDNVYNQPTCNQHCDAVLEHLHLWQTSGAFVSRNTSARHVKAAMHLLATARDFIDDYALKCQAPNARGAAYLFPRWAHRAFLPKTPNHDAFATLSSRERRRFYRATLQAELFKLVYMHTGSQDLCVSFLTSIPMFQAEEIRCILEQQERLWRLVIYCFFRWPYDLQEPSSFSFRVVSWTQPDGVVVVTRTRFSDFVILRHLQMPALCRLNATSLGHLVRTLKARPTVEKCRELRRFLRTPPTTPLRADQVFSIRNIVYYNLAVPPHVRRLRVVSHTRPQGSSDPVDYPNALWQSWRAHRPSAQFPGLAHSLPWWDYPFRRLGYVFWDAARVPGARFVSRNSLQQQLPVCLVGWPREGHMVSDI